MTCATLDGIIVANVSIHKFFILATPGVDMATENTVNIGLNLDTNAGAVTKEIINLRDLLLNTAAIAARINVGGGAGMPPGAGPDRVRRPPPRDPSGTGGTTGSRAVSDQGRYGALRGVAGETGSAASNFAEQAQGMGGLVRLYATFAANIYAATAAFSALSKAGDLTNLTKGLDQLGASSGKNLGDLAKRLVDITDGGLAATDAMAAVAKASSAGLSTKNIEDLATVSKKAAQALGLDMSSAFDRLSRGVTKLEPELLDELGLFTKIGPATEEYARKMGKSVTSLTDFEKRQAFANAVLKEGIDKFGEINLISNPYARLAASLANITQSGLELVNKVLGPLVGFLSQSPTALLGIIGLIGATFLKSTIPIIGKFRSTMDQLQAESMVKMNTAAAAQLAAAAKNDDRLTMQAQKYYETSRAVTEKGEKVIADAKAKFGAGGSLSTKGGADIGALLKKAPQTLTEAEMSSLAAQRDKLSNSLSGTQRKDAAAYAAHYDQIVASRKDFDQGMKEAGAKAGKDAMAADSSRFSNYQRLVRDSDKATAQFSKNSILAMQAQANETKGPIAAFKELRQNVRDAQGGKLQVTSMQGVVDKSGKAVLDAAGVQKMEQVTTHITDKMGKLDAATTLVKGGFASLTRGITNTLSALGPWAQAAGLAIAGFELLDHWLSAANKDIELFDSSIVKAKENIAFLPKTLDALNKQDISKWMSPESLTARANAIKGISDSVDEAVKKFKEIVVVSNAWDNLLDSFAGLFGKSRLDILSKTLNASILANIKAMPTGNLREEFTNKVKELTGVKEVTKEALSELGTYSIETITALNMAEKSSSLNLSNLASDAGAAKAALEALTKTGQELATSLIPGDPVTKYGLGLIAVGEGLDRTFKTATGGFEELVRIASSADVAKNFGAQGKDLLENVVQLKALRNEYNANDKALRDLTDNQQKFLDARKTARNDSYQATEGRAVPVDTSAQRALQVELVEADKKALSEEILRRQNASKDLLAKQATQVAKYSDLGLEAYKKGIELVGKGFELKIAEAAQKLRGAVAGALTNIEGIQLKTEVSLKEADLRIANNNIMIQLIRVQEDVALTGKLQAAQTAENTNAQKISNAQGAILAAVQAGASLESINVMDAELQELKKLTPALQQTTKSVGRAKTINETGVGFKQYAGLATSEDSGDRETAALLKTAALSTEAQRTANAQEEYNKKVTRLNGALEEIKQKYVNINELINYGITFNEHNLKVLQQLSSTSNSMFFQRLANTAAEEIEGQKSLLLDNERLQLAERYARLKKDATQDQIKVAANEQREYEALDRKVKLQDLSNVSSKLGRSIADITKQADIEIKADTVLKNLADQRLQLQIARVDANQSELETRKNILGISNEEYAVATGRNQLAKLELNYAKETSDIAKTQADAAKAALAEKSKADAIAAAIVAKPSEKYSDTAPTVLSIGSEDIAAAEKLRFDARNQAEKDYAKLIGESTAAAAAAGAVARTNFDTNIAAAQAGISLATQTGAFDDLIKKIDSLGVSLSGAFGDFGTKLGAGLKTGVTAVEDARKQQLGLDTKYAKDKADAEDEINTAFSSGTEQEKKQALAKSLSLDKKYASDSTKTELEKNTKLVGAAKGLFAEKTFAYKALAAVEKGLHTYKMLMDAKELAMDLWKTGQAVINSITRSTAAVGEATVDGTAAVVNQGKGDPYSAPFRMAAMAVIVAALLSSIGGGSGPTVSTAGKTSADRQSLGAGEEYVGGVKRDTGGGVLGDPTAKSESIAKSIEILNATQVEGLSYDNKMVQLLTSIDKSIGKAALGIYGTVGLTKGSALGTTEGTTASSVLWGLFSDSTSTEILDSGIKFAGSFKAIMGNIKGTIQGFETVKTTSTSSNFWGLFSDTSSSIQDQAIELGDTLTESIAEVFKNGGKFFVESGAKLGMTAESVIAQLADIEIDKLVSLRGLKGEDLEKEFNSIISGILDDTAKKLFTNLTKYAKFGEGMLQTVTRVIDTNEKINLSLNSIGLAGLNTSGVLTEVSIAITQDMADAAGGLDKFLDHVKFFADNLLTEAERLVPITTKVTASMTDITATAKDLGFIAAGASGIVDTNAEFKALYLTVSQGTTPAAIELRHQLDLVTESFIKTTAQFEDLVKQVGEINSDSATQFMDDIKKLIYTRNKEREAISAANQPLFDMITALKLASLDLTSAGKALQDGYKKVVAEADKAEAALLSVAKAGLATLETEAKTLRTTLATLATNGLKLLETEATNAKTKLKDLIFNGFGLLTTKLTGLQGELQALGTTGFTTLTQEVSKVKDSIKASYKTAVDAQKSANKAFIDSLKTVGTGIKDFLKTVASGDLGITDQATKYKALRTEFDKTLAAAKSGDEVALGKLPQISQDLLTAAKEQASTKVQYARTFAEVTSQLGDISAVLDAKVQTAEQSAADGVAALELSTLSTADALKAANEELAKWTDTIQRSGVVVEIDTEANTATKLSTASGALDALTTAQTNLNDWLDLIGTDSASLLTKVNPTTITELKESFETIRTNIADVNTTINTYIKDNNEILKTAGYTGDDLLKNLPVTLTVDNTKAQIDALVGIVKGAEVALTVYIAGTTTFLENNGFSTADIDKILARADTPLTKANTQDKLDEAVARVDASEAAITAYIARTNTILVAAGFGENDLLKRTKILTLDAAVDSASLAFDTAVLEVDKWADKLTELGISFTPYGEPKDVGLVALTTNFLTAQTAFNTANASITSWIDNITNLVNSITLPASATVARIIAPVVDTTPAVRVPTAEELWWEEYYRNGANSGGGGGGGPGAGGWALGGAFDSGSLMKFAAGDSFSNSIVDTPTKFRMGLMGEAGPEAIMPLTRGPDGSLGVTAQMPNFSNSSNEANMVLVNEIKELRNEVAKLRVIAGQNEYNTRKTKETLQLVTVGGEYMQTKTVT